MLCSAEPDHYSVWIKEQALLNNSTVASLPSPLYPSTCLLNSLQHDGRRADRKGTPGWARGTAGWDHMEGEIQAVGLLNYTGLLEGTCSTSTVL